MSDESHYIRLPQTILQSHMDFGLQSHVKLPIAWLCPFLQPHLSLLAFVFYTTAVPQGWSVPKTLYDSPLP